MHDELKQMYDLDIADHREMRVFGSPEYDEMRKRDARRRSRVRTILNEPTELDPVDLYRAAWILNHGDSVPDAELACQVAEQSNQGGHEPAKWLFAAAYDRWCMYRGLPQKFGTQIVPDGERYRVWDTCPETTDEDRRAYNVPSLNELAARAAREYQLQPQPPMEFAPRWLQNAIERWRLDSSQNSQADS